MFSHTNAQRRACSASSEGMLSFEIGEGVSYGMPSRIQHARGRPLPRERLFFGRWGSECQQQAVMGDQNVSTRCIPAPTDFVAMSRGRVMRRIHGARVEQI